YYHHLSAGTDQQEGHRRSGDTRQPDRSRTTTPCPIYRLPSHPSATKTRPGPTGTTSLCRTRSPHPTNPAGTTTATQPHHCSSHRLPAKRQRHTGTPGLTITLRTYPRPIAVRATTGRRTQRHPSDVTATTRRRRDQKNTRMNSSHV